MTSLFQNRPADRTGPFAAELTNDGAKLITVRVIKHADTFRKSEDAIKYPHLLNKLECARFPPVLLMLYVVATTELGTYGILVQPLLHASNATRKDHFTPSECF
ncbi:jg21843 [Pararge aegeria aegeria]|uniref:Jg21843 protein n=1 Tax=Pararge aegeria aegeria TaxID=348720 RepID=A0A8S4QFZ9_9NEOP|nr:jg21843 [Pararge aegeria aegeria]